MDDCAVEVQCPGATTNRCHGGEKWKCGDPPGGGHPRGTGNIQLAVGAVPDLWHPLQVAAKKKKGEKASGPGERLISKNRRASFNYELGERFEAGVALVGSEARCLRESPADLTDAWVDVKGGQAYVKGMRIPTLKHSFLGHEETRARRLLLHRAEIEKLVRAVERDRMTLVVTKAYFLRGRVKIEVAVGRGKKLHDKRETVKQRTADREARVAIERGKIRR